ncbi:MAG TPA: ComEC/Rec2 family competence protein, partial [bacterium]|nr:ComEC/Rec2 family competence protein [bacterium]
MEKRLIWAGYLFIAGVASGFAVFSDFDAYKPFLFNLSLINILLSVLLSGGILLAARLLKSMTLFWIVLLLTVFSAGLYRYLQANSLGEVHITDFLDDSFWANTEIVGDVIKEPSIRENKIYLLIRPVKLKKEKEKEWRDIPPKAGNVMVSIFPTVGEYYNNCDYGDRLWFKGALVEPFTATNPTGFDYRRYLKRIFQAYATMSVKRPVNIEKRGSGGNWFIRWVLRLKWKMLASIKRTMPYPESAFLGGVTLGSRAGVPLYMRFQFQSTGIAHVLAVSGLHAGFAAALALAFCSILRLVRVKKFVVMVFSLLVFAIITGASPATTRSCLMLTIGLFLHTFANMGIKASTRMTIPVSAIILLAVNPLYLPEGSFVLSYAAVWSLAHLTDPVRAFFQRYIKGWSFISFFFSLFFVLSIFIIKPEVALGQQDVLYRYLMILFIVNLFAYHVLERFFPLEGLNLDEIHKLPFCSYLIDFFYAQGAIQLGMNAVLSMVFFGKYSLSGTLANYIAIPLIGVCVQMGLITSLLDVVLKSIGLGQIGYVLATFAAMGNYWWCHLFLKVAEFFYNLYPYPYTLAPNTLELILFYAFIVSLALYEEVSELFLKVPWARIVYAALFIVPLGFNFWGNVMKEKGKAEFTFFDLSFGQGTLIRSPNGKYFLVDGGGSFIHSEDIPLTLGKYRIKELEGIILTNPRPENIGNMGTPPGGLLAVLSGYKVKNFYSAVP